MRNANDVLGRSTQSDPAVPEPASDITGPIIDERRDFRSSAIPAGMEPTRKDKEQDPYAKPYRISSIYELAPAGGSGVQFTALAGEGNGRWSTGIDFEAHAILVSNWSAQYIYFPTIGAWLAPWIINSIITVPRGVTSLDVKFIAPAGIALPAVVASHFVTLQAYEGFLAPTSGISLNALVGTGVTRMDIEQIAGVAVSAGPSGQMIVSLGDVLGNTIRAFGAGDLLNALQSSQPASTPGAATATAGIATVTFAAVAGQSHRITSVGASYAAVASTAATSTVTVSDGTTLLVFDVSTAINGNGFVGAPPPGGWKFIVNTTVTVVLVSGVAAGSVGNVNASKLTA